VLRINLEHGLELYGKETIQLPEDLAAYASNPIIVACPGSSTCAKALTDGWATAERIRQVLARQDSPDVRISISGCPNNCAHSAVADIGLVGLLRKQKGRQIECYRLFKGGGNGKSDKLAEQCETICAHDVPTTIKHLLEAAKPTNA